MLEITKAHEIIRKIQEFRLQISHKTIHGKRMLSSKNEA